jgi:hypothetical protein
MAGPSSPPPTLLDAVMPSYDAHEVHATRVDAPAPVIHHALFTVRSDEIPLSRALLTLRGLRAPGADGSRPMLESAQEGGFAILADEPGREVVLGVIGRFWRLRDRDVRPIASAAAFTGFAEPGYARAAMNFLIEPLAPGGCRLTTETRISATDARARRAFRAYWLIVHPGSALIRRMWLRALRRRAEGEAS